MDELQFAQTVQAELEQKITGSPYDPSLADNIWEMMVAMNRAAAQQLQGETYEHNIV